MLVLTRRRGENVVVGGNVTFEILEVKHGKVKVGITAPEDVAIRREEIIARTTTPIQSSIEDVADLGRRSTDEAANGFVPDGCVVIGDEV